MSNIVAFPDPRNAPKQRPPSPRRIKELSAHAMLLDPCEFVSFIRRAEAQGDQLVLAACLVAAPLQLPRLHRCPALRLAVRDALRRARARAKEVA